MTLIDIFNDRYEHLGIEDKKSAHAQGLWHRTFSALAINPTTRRVILQKKTPGCYSFARPDYAAITVGGHYQAGEAIPDGVREVHDELGLPVSYDDLHPIGLRQTAVTLPTTSNSSSNIGPVAPGYRTGGDPAPRRRGVRPGGPTTHRGSSRATTTSLPPATPPAPTAA